MRKVRGMRKFAYASVVMVAMFAASIGVWQVNADEGYSDEILVTLSSLATDRPLTIYTPGGTVQDPMPIGVRTQLGREPIAFGQVMEPALSVNVTTGGSVEETDGVPEVVDAIETVSGDLLGFTPSGSFYLSAIDVSLLDYTEENVRGVTGLVAQDFLRSLAVAESYYVKGETTIDLVEELLDITVLDADLVDGDGNGIPDATALLEPFTLMMGPNGNITYVVDLGELDRGDNAFNGQINIGLQTDEGPFQVIVDAPTMNQLAAADAAYNMYAGRLIVTIGDDAQDLIDIPEGTDPASEFDLQDGPFVFPDPEGFFIRIAMALTDAVDLRGTVPVWTFLDVLPDDLEIEIEISGPGVTNQLTPGDTGFAYMYGTTTTQSGDDILIEAGSGWTGLPNIEIANFYNGDDFERGGNEVETGDDAIFITFRGASGIYASNLMPELSSDGGGGGSHCFIATAAYGTPMATEIQSLRDVRDAYLIDTALGAAFVDAYYRVSPPVARMVSEYPAAKATVRALLAPVVAVSGWTMASPGIVTAIALVILIAAITRIHGFVRVPGDKQ